MLKFIYHEIPFQAADRKMARLIERVDRRYAKGEKEVLAKTDEENEREEKEKEISKEKI